MPNLYVAMYQSQHGVYEHWALYLQHDLIDTIYEVIGQLPDFRPNVLLKNPSATTRHKRNIFLYDISVADITEFENVLLTLTPANTPESWNCQNYVMDVLGELENKKVIDKDDAAYIEAKKELMKHFGPLSRQIGTSVVRPTTSSR